MEFWTLYSRGTCIDKNRCHLNPAVVNPYNLTVITLALNIVQLHMKTRDL